MSRQLNLIVCAAALICCSIARVAFAQDEEILPGAPDMAGKLAQEGSYLFPEGQRAELDAINRDLRMAQDQLRGAPSDEAKQKAREQRNSAAQRLKAKLESCATAIPVAINAAGAVLPAANPVALPGESGVLLFKVTAGDGPPRCIVLDLDFAKQSQPRLPVQVAPGCVTWVLVNVTDMPILKIQAEFEFSTGPGPKTVLHQPLTSAERGALRIHIIAEDTKKEVPAMVRIVRKSDGHFIQPPNALEFAPEFDSQGTASGRRPGKLPGRLAGTFWCVPGSFDLLTSPGDYDVVVHIGIEYLPVFDSVTLTPGGTIERTYTLKRWVNMSQRGWYSGDDHVHFQMMSDTDAQKLMTWTKAEDVHLVNVVKMGDIYRTWFEQRGFGPKFRVRDGTYVLSPGQECPRTHNELGHTIQMNIKNMIRDTDKYYLYDTVFDAVHAQGGLSGYAHVNSGIFHVNRDMSMNIAKEKIDFVEVLQFASLGTDLYYDFLNTGFKVTASAGSDVPWGGSIGEVRVYANCGKHKFTADRWFDAIRKGHTFVTNGVMLDFTVDGALPGDEIRLKGDKPLHVKAKAWGAPGYTAPTKLEIITLGDVTQHIDSTDPNRAELNLDFTVSGGSGFWIAARAEGADGSRALTTPIYVVREGLRFWRFDSVDDLIAKRLASLAEIEQIVAEAQALDQKGEIADSRPRKLLAEQGPELLKRVQDARAIYQHLKDVQEQERPVREQLAKRAAAN